MSRYGLLAPSPQGRTFAFADPGFGAHFAITMAEHRLPLPEWLGPGPLREYGDALLSREPFSPAVREAVRLGCTCFDERTSDLFWREVNRLRLCLLTEEPCLDAISQCAGISVAGLHAYNELFFNVRDREWERDYLAGLFYSEINAGPLFPDNIMRNWPYEELVQHCTNYKDVWQVPKIALCFRPKLTDLGSLYRAARIEPTEWGFAV